jgi:hypothetical protein
MKLHRPLCILCWILSLPLIMAAMSLSLRGEEPTAEKLPDGLEVVSITAEPAVVDLKHPLDYRQVLLTGTLKTGEQVDLTRMATLAQPATKVTVTPNRRLEALVDGEESLTFSYAGQSVKVAVKVANTGAAIHPSFVRDVQPVLSKMSCNAGTCHGAKDGKAGFKLSLRGYDPIYDHRALTDDIGGRRFNRVAPDQSLMLLKATGSVPHVGGVRTEVDSPYYELVRQWIAGGVKLDLDAPRVTSIDIAPKDPIVPRAGMKQQITVTATYSDGTTRDVTREAFIESGDIEILAAESSGIITMLRRGEAPVLVRYEGSYAATTLIVMGDRSGFVWQQPPTNNYVDELVYNKLQRVKILPSELCTDADFVRRVTIDLTGLPPTSDQVRAFLADPRPTKEKRDALVDQLVGSRGYVEHWTNKWADLLQVNRKFLGEEGAIALRNWIKDAVSTNKPYDQLAYEVLTASGSNLENAPAAYWKTLRDPAGAMENTTHLFLAVRFNCNKCHDHPFERWTQDQYYQMSQYFAQVGRKVDPAFAGQNIGGSAVEGAVPLVEVIYDSGGGDVKHDRTGQVVAPKFPYPHADLAAPTAPRREQLARWMTSKENQYFAKSYVNRLWGYLLGRGIIEPIDDIRAGNPPTNPQLLDALTKDFIEHGFDQQHVLKTICKSRVYQHSVVTNKWNEDDELNNSRAIPRRLPAETLFDAIHLATGSQARIPGVPVGFRAAELPDAGVSLPFLEDFGRPVRESSCECERSSGMVLGPIMKLVNGPTVADAIGDPANALMQLFQKEPDDKKAIEEMFLRFLGRVPTEEEQQLGIESLHAASGDHQAIVAKLAEYEKTLPAKQAEWEKNATADTTWTVLDVADFKSAAGATIKKLDDKSVLVEGNLAQDVYTVTLNTDMKNVTGLRLEALPDDSLGAKGPGRAMNGNFVLHELTLSAAPKSDASKVAKIELGNASADFSQESWAVAGAIDGNPGTGWAVSPKFGEPHTAIFETKSDIAHEGGSTLTVALSQQYADGKHLLGRFRLSVTTSPRPFGAKKLPDNLAAIIKKALDQRSPEEAKQVADFYRAMDSQLATLTADVARSAEQMKNQRLVGLQDLAWALINNPAFLFNR